MLAAPLRGVPLIRTGRYGIRPAGAGGTDASPDHRAVDMRAAEGTPVYPIEPGRVVQIRRMWRSHAAPGPIEGERIFTQSRAGNLVVVRGKHGDVDYSHLYDVAGDISVGDDVGLDTRLGRTGRTGVVQPHLHLGINVRRVANGKPYWTPIDPTPLLPWGTVATAPTTTTTEGATFVTYTPTQEQELLETVRAIRRSQITPEGYTYDAALLSLVQGLYGALSKVAEVDVDALAAQLREQIKLELPDDVGDDVVDALVERIKPR